MKEHYGEVGCERAGHVAVLSIDRPPNNHVSVELIRSLADALADIDAEKDLRAVVLQTAGKVFCAGADLVS
ncbi:MAG: enoyl-CoA hydratase/isomerase family protein, partial [Caulobacteraceae bacterium]